MNSKKIDFRMFGVLIVGLASACFAQESLTLPPEDDRFPTEEIFLPADSPITPDELASPPAGEFKKVFLRDLVAAKNHVTALLAHIQSKGDSVNPLAIMQANALIQGLDTAITTRSLQDALALDELYDAAWLVWRWDSVHAPFNYFDKYGFLMFHCFEQINQQNGGVLSYEFTRKFAHAFYATSKIPWESEGVDGHRSFSKDSMWLCNPSALSSALKEMEMNGVGHFSCPDTLEWLGKPDSLTLPVLRARYQADPGLFDAALAEYRNWASTTLDTPPPADEISKREVIGLKQESARLAKLIELVEHGTTGKNHALFPKLKTYKAALDHLAVTVKIVDVKEVILASLPFEQEWLKIQHIMEKQIDNAKIKSEIAALGLPAYFYDIACLLGVAPFERTDPEGVSATIADGYDKYCTSGTGNLPAELFDYEYLWVAKPETARNEVAADVFVLFADQMTERIKSLSLTERLRILEYKGDLLDTPAKFFKIFTDAPDDHPDYVLTRYQANKAEIDTKFSALIQWHKSQPAEQ